jgi:type I restriction enzyme S subunit
MENQLPKNWKCVKVGEFVTCVKGKKPKRVSNEKTKACSIPYVNIKAFEKNIIDEYTDGSGCVFCDDGDFLMVWDGSRSGYVGKAIKGALGSTLVKLNFQDIYNNYAYYFLQSKYLDINTKAKGVGIPHVDPHVLWNYDLLIPPKLIQEAIVSKIEELFSELDKGIENLRLAQQQLKTYRQAVLKWAFEGKLTNEKVKDGELPKGWKRTKLQNVCEKIQDGSHFSPQIQYNDPGKNRFKYITAKNIRNGYMDFRKVVYVDKEFHDSIYGRCNPEFGDVLLTKDGINTGEVTLNTLHEPFSLLSSVCIFKTKKKELKSEFLKYFIQSPWGSKAILNSMTGTAIKRIVLRKIKDSEIVLPLLEEQYNIVQEIEKRLSVVDKMEQSITQSLQQAESLRQSILKRAFEGKLIQTETVARKAEKVIPVARKILAGKIIHLMHQEKYFGLTKFQKMLYLVENFSQVEYPTNFIRERAGPYDKDFTQAFRHEMQDNDWFSEKQKGSITKFVPRDNVGALISGYREHFRGRGPRIVFVIQQLMDKSSHEVELIATLYAVWNNRLIRKRPVKEKELLEDFFNWSAKKKEEFQEEEVCVTYKWMKKVKLIPVGFGKFIG